ncbi:hypothetical protein XENTR_v10024823 [Xenopus tropicalis]|nr:hypothetical protein XENTR_v10024823 [Xenopus tropicalis]
MLGPQPKWGEIKTEQLYMNPSGLVGLQLPASSLSHLQLSRLSIGLVGKAQAESTNTNHKSHQGIICLLPNPCVNYSYYYRLGVLLSTLYLPYS